MALRRSDQRAAVIAAAEMRDACCRPRCRACANARPPACGRSLTKAPPTALGV